MSEQQTDQNKPKRLVQILAEQEGELIREEAKVKLRTDKIFEQEDIVDIGLYQATQGVHKHLDPRNINTDAGKVTNTPESDGKL